MRLLFLCTGNSCRSQMAEGFARSLAGPEVEVWSAGTRPASRVSSRAVQVMAERGIDISKQEPKTPDVVPAPVDVVVTLCDSAAGECPTFPGTRTVEHWGLPDPADATGSDLQVLQVFRNSRDDIARRVAGLMTRLTP